MITKKRIIEVSPTLFVNSLPTEKHDEVRALFDDENVDYVVLLISKLDGTRQVIAVGRKSAYTKIADVTTDLIDGMRAKAFVDAHKPFPDLSKKHSPRKSIPPMQTTKLKNSGDPLSKVYSEQNALLQNQVDELKHKLAEELSKTMLQEQTITELKRRAEQDTPATQKNSTDESLLSDRESAVLKTEEELLNRLTYLMEKEAELDQLKENLAHREQCLEEREGKSAESQT